MKLLKGKPESAPKRVLRLPDLDHTKLSVLDTLGSTQSQTAYARKIGRSMSCWLEASNVHALARSVI